MIYKNNIKLLDSKWLSIIKNVCDIIEKDEDKFLDKIIIFGSTFRNECNKVI